MIPPPAPGSANGGAAWILMITTLNQMTFLSETLIHATAAHVVDLTSRREAPVVG